MEVKTKNGRHAVDVTEVTRYRNALVKIMELERATKMRGVLTDLGVPKHLIEEGGWVPISPQVKEGIMVAVKIAKEGLGIS